MRRNCPHCGVDQVVADEKLTAGWIFLKCHHCSATSALQGKASLRLMQLTERPVRSPAKPIPVKSEIASTSIKIDEPSVEIIKPVLSLPPVPEFLKAESSEKSKKIDKTQLTQKAAPKSEPVPAPTAPVVSAAPAAMAVEVEKEFDDFVEPLLFEPENTTSQHEQPVPILLEEEKAPSRFYEAATEWASEFAERTTEFAQTLKPYTLPILLAVICFGSGGYLLRSAKQIREGAWLLPNQNPVNVASDVAPSAASPYDSAPQAPAPQTAAVQAQVAVKSAPAQAQAAAQTQDAPVRVIASTHAQRALANRVPASQGATSSATDEKVEVLTNNAVLRAGPGLHYNKVGTARAELQLLVKGTFDNWIEVRTGGGSKTAWIRSDLVKPIKQVAQQEAQP